MVGARTVTAPNGERWRVGRRWLNRPVPKLFRPRRARRQATGGADRTEGILGALDPTMGLDVGDSLALLGIAVGVFVVFLLVVFVLLPLIGIALELALAIGFVSSGLFGRLVLRRPWTIEAVSLDAPERRSAFAVTGWRRSGRALAALAAAIETTGPPAALPEAEPVAPGGAGALG
jgi:hypothetical protein